MVCRSELSAKTRLRNYHPISILHRFHRLSSVSWLRGCGQSRWEQRHTEWVTSLQHLPNSISLGR
jgi:hypothetical protein